MIIFVQSLQKKFCKKSLYHFPVFMQCCTANLFELQTFKFVELLLEAKLLDLLRKVGISSL